MEGGEEEELAEEGEKWMERIQISEVKLEKMES